MGWFRNLFGKDKEEVAKTSSSAKGDGTKRPVLQRDVITNNSSRPNTANRSNNSTQQRQSEVVNPILKGWDAFNKGDELWDKGRKAEAVKHYEQAITEGYGNNDRHYVHLGVYYTERKDWGNLKRILNICPRYMLTQNWVVDGKRLMEETIGKMPNGWIIIESDKTANVESWQEQYERMTSSFPQFDFDGKYEDEIREEDVTALREFTKGLRRKQREAKDLIARKDYQSAAEQLAEFVSNGYWKPEPYEMLMDIYHKAGLETERKRLAEHALAHFTKIRAAQRDLILRYATAQDCRDKIEEYIDDGNPIYYGDGLFSMYSPYPETEKWQKLIGG